MLDFMQALSPNIHMYLDPRNKQVARSKFES